MCVVVTHPGGVRGAVGLGCPAGLGGDTAVCASWSLHSQKWVVRGGGSGGMSAPRGENCGCQCELCV